MRQVVDVTGYKATGLTALFTWYARNDAASTIAFIATITALDASSVAIGSATSSGTLTPADGAWQRYDLTKALPAGTAKIQLDINPTTNAALDVDGLRLQIGQMSAELLSNGSFDTGDTTDWTDVTNSFVASASGYATSDGSASTAVQGGAFASSEVKQEAAVPAGYEYGEAVLEFARANEFADDGEVVIEVLNGASAVIASATTGAESVASGWERRRLCVALPDAAATLRVRLLATRALGSGNSGALFDDFSLRVHKDLDPAFERELDFTTPHRQAMPRTWGEAYLAWHPLAIPMVWDGDDGLPDVLPSQHNAAATAAWSDASTPMPAKFVGFWTHDEDAMSVDAYRFVRALAASAVDLQIDGYGAFAKADVFSVAVCFRVTELAMSLACGLVGNRESGGKGWGLSLDTSGRVVAGVHGTTPRTAVGTVDHRDGAPHWVLLTWNGSTLRVVDALGTATNASDPGEFANSEPMRIGRDGPSSATGGIDIARVLVWEGTAISQTDFGSIVDRIGDDPNGLVAWTSSQPVWTDAEDDADGATIVRHATRHVPISKRGDYGVSIGAANTNLLLSNDFAAGSHCGPEADVTVEHGIVDPTGFARGVRISNAVADRGYRLTDIPLGANNVRAVFYARTADGSSQNLKAELLDSDENSEDNDVIVIGPTWQRIERLFAWTAPTPTGHLRFAIHDNSPCIFELAHVVCVGQLGASANGVPTAYGDPSVAVGDRHGVVTETMPIQLNYEGEIEIEATVTVPVVCTLTSVDNNATFANRRSLHIQTLTDLPTFDIRDNALVSTTVVGAGSSWSSTRRLRGRWNTLALPETLTGETIAIAEDETVEDSDNPAFAVSATVPSEKIRIGGGDPFGSTSPHALLHRVVVRSREEKLG